ncbi:MAG: type III pantothenate kinase, partial [Phycisphaerae bacterium]|nr:type III pantothenate kinase [Phycisphaerae bacterium]
WLAQAWKDLPEGSDRYVVVSSVAPAAFDVVSRLIVEHCDGEAPILIGRDIPPAIQVNVPEPEKVGTDRLCAAAAAHKWAKDACVVASFGTALTVDLVSDDGVFMGGAILPGMATAAHSLHEHTALLPDVEMTAPQEVWGTSTQEAVRVGVLCGLAGALRSLTERYATAIGRWPRVILTGGDAEAVVAGGVDFADAVVSDLCLHGIALALEQALVEAQNS